MGIIGILALGLVGLGGLKKGFVGFRDGVLRAAKRRVEGLGKGAGPLKKGCRVLGSGVDPLEWN